MKIAYVHSICMQHDAISNSLRDEIRWLMPAHEVHLFTYACDHPDLPCTIVQNVEDLVLHPHFQQADLVVFHFGVYYPLFDAITICPYRARRLVVFHNITPKAFVPLGDHDTVRRSFEQLSNLVFAHHVACDSQTNLDVMRECGINVPGTILPLALHSSPTPPALKPSALDAKVRIAFIGRFVKSKGAGELIAALDLLLQDDDKLCLQLDLVGNLKFSDLALLEAIRLSIARLHHAHGERIHVTIHGNASDEAKSQLLSDADLFVLPTYHEGFCVPILEALASGCRVISYANSNVPSISGGLATLLPTGDVAALAAAMGRDARNITQPAWLGSGADSYRHHAEQAARYVAAFHPERIRRRFLTFLRDFSRNTF